MGFRCGHCGEQIEQHQPHCRNCTATLSWPSTPALETWKTSILFSALGLLCPALAVGALFLIFHYLFIAASPEALSVVRPILSVLIPILALAYIVLLLSYPSKVYPSYFSEKPRLRSARQISFLNCFVGGLVFGLLWNRNLTRCEKGISNYVLFAVII